MLAVEQNIIQGVLLKQLPKNITEKGNFMSMIKVSDPYFENFGEISFSTLHPEKINGWCIHTELTSNFVVLSGNAKLVMFDDREFSSTKGKVHEVYFGQDNYCLVKVPNMIWFSFKAIGADTAIIANCSTKPHFFDELKTVDIVDNHIPYKW